jgi:3-isopropylmalate/(R)-2-methylmalate dehydratase small subunit
MTKFTPFESRVVPFPIDNLDTDQIIPARFLKTISKEGLGAQLFYDWRYDAEGKPKPDFILNTPESKAAKILLAGDNFGCGSSREHAPWALLQYGFRAVISTSFADIFRGNALKNSLLPIVVPRDIHAELFRDPNVTVKVDLAAQTLTLPDGKIIQFPVDAFAKHCLVEGIDELGYILQQEPAIASFEAAHPAHINTASSDQYRELRSIPPLA